MMIFSLFYTKQCWKKPVPCGQLTFHTVFIQQLNPIISKLKQVPDGPDFRPLLEFINCKIRLLHLYVQLYQNSAGKPKIAPDFREFINLLEMNREDNFKKYLANNEDQDKLFCNVKLELQTLEYIIQFCERRSQNPENCEVHGVHKITVTAFTKSSK